MIRTVRVEVSRWRFVYFAVAYAHGDIWNTRHACGLSSHAVIRRVIRKISRDLLDMDAGFDTAFQVGEI